MASPNDVVSAVLQHPAYQELLRRRTRLSYLFFFITLVIYSGFILTLAFDPTLFGSPVGSLTISIGIMTAIFVAISAVVLISIYVYISNKIFDPLLAKIVRDVT